MTVSESLFVCFLAPECFPEFFSTKLSPADKLYTYRWKAGEFIVQMLYSQFILETEKRRKLGPPADGFFYNFPPTPISPPRSRPPYHFYK